MPHPVPATSVRARRRPASIAAITALALCACVAPVAAQQSADEPSTAPTGTSGASGPGGPDATSAAPEGLRLTRAQTRRLQRKVRVRPDGAFGPSTRSALRRWERRAGLASDGRPDPEVLGRMRIRLTRAQAALSADGSVGAERAAPAPEATAAAGKAVDAAMAQEGTPYASGGERPGGFDCSGLTSWAFGEAGITLPRTSFAQFEVGTAVPRDEIRAGDLVFFDSAGPGASDVGIATSATKVVSATTHGVMEHETFDAYWGGHYVGARRVTSSS